jgi:hypothetical protein
MLFLTQKKLQQKVDEAVAAQAGEIQALRDVVETMRADQAEREAEFELQLVRRLTEERDLQNAGVQGLLEAVWAVRDRPEPVFPEIPDLAPQIAEATRLASQALDVATYALESPLPDPIVLPAPTPRVGQIVPGFPHGWVRPLGAS